MYAALNDMETKALPTMMDDFACRLVINAKGRLCLLHDVDLPAIPLWIRHSTKLKMLSIVFDNGTTKYLDFEIDERTASYLLNTNRVFVCRVQEGQPVEGYDTVLLNEAY